MWCSGVSVALQTNISHSGQNSKGNDIAVCWVFPHHALVFPWEYLLGHNLRNFKKNILQHSQSTEVTLLPELPVVVISGAQSSYLELFGAAATTCPEHIEVCSTHSFLSCLRHSEGHGSIAEVRHSINNCTEAESWTLIPPVSFGLPPS